MTWTEIIQQTAFLRGRVLHGGTGEPVDGKLEISIEEGPCVQHILEDGNFALSGKTAELFPDLSTRAYQIHFLVRAVSDTFRAGYREYAATVTIPDGTQLEPSRDNTIDDLPSAGTITMPADPITVRIRLFDASASNNPLSGADVKVSVLNSSNNPSSSNGNLYEFRDLTPAAVFSVSCSKATYHSLSDLQYPVDFTRDVQEVAIAMTKDTGP